ncbi:hypothetical protein ACVGW2_00110, partial [Enterobacter intestinihominis]
MALRLTRLPVEDILRPVKPTPQPAKKTPKQKPLLTLLHIFIIKIFDPTRKAVENRFLCFFFKKIGGGGGGGGGGG